MLGNSPAAIPTVEAGCSERPFASPRRAYPHRHSHSGIFAPGLSLRFPRSRFENPLTSALRSSGLWARGTSTSGARDFRYRERFRQLRLFCSPPGFFVPSGSKHSEQSLAKSLPERDARSPFAPPPRPAINWIATGSSLGARYASPDSLFLQPLGTKSMMRL
jgi:hypothetical protein